MKQISQFTSELNDITRLAAVICEVPFGFIGIFRGDDIILHAAYGFDFQPALQNFPRLKNNAYEESVCQLANAEELQNLKNYFGNVTSNHLNVSFFVSVPFRNDKRQLTGVMCLLDNRVKTLTKSQGESLKLLGNKISKYFGLGDVTSPVKSGVKRVLEKRFAKLSYYHNAILNGTDYGVIFTDINGMIKTFNQGAEVMMGYNATEVIDAGFFPAINISEGFETIYLTREPLDSKFEHYAAKVAKAGAHTTDAQLIRKDGTTLNVQFSFKGIYNEEKQIIGFLTVLEDITERKKIESDLKSAKLLAEKGNKAKDQFLANMSHEIRTPMNAIIGFTDVLWNEQLSHEQKEYLGAIKSAGTNLLGIINDILDFSKIESGNLSLETIPFSVKEVVFNACSLFKVRAQEKGLVLKVLIDPYIPESLLGDPVRLNQILYNLIGNAIKFTELGEVEVSVSLENETNTESKIKFKVRDSGIGIPKDKLESVFKRFTQASNETTRTYGGTGLGSSISKSLVKMFGGDLSLNSELNKGSEFLFSIVFKKNHQPLDVSKPKSVAKNNSGKTLKILLVEDNELNQKLAKKVINDFGYEVTLAENGRIALAKLSSDSYDIILMDLQMPEMDGYQATTEIRQALRLNTPIIALTAHSLVGEKNKCIELGMNDYLAKPFKAEDLFYKLNQFTTNTPVNSEKIKHQGTSDTKISLEKLKELSGGDKNFEKEMLELFIKNSHKSVLDLDEALKNDNLTLIKKIAHSFKSSVAIFELDEVAKKLSMLEKPDTSRELTIALIEGIKAELQPVTPYLKVLLLKNYQ